MNTHKAVRVLIVEDNALFSKSIQRMLEDIGYTVAGTAADGLDGIHMAQSLRPDVILMDVGMPKMDGIQATQHIQTHCPTPVVILTAYEPPDLLEQASAAGVGAYLVKPPKPSEIERAITIAMARFADMLELRKSKQQVASILESISDGFFALDNDLVVTYFNQAAERLLSRTSEEVLGHPLFQAFPEGRGSIFEEKYIWALKEKSPTSFEVYFGIRPYENWYDVRVYPYQDGISVYFQITTERKRAEEERERLIVELQQVLAKVKTLSGMLPICASCKKIRDDRGYWNQVEVYIEQHSEAEFTHGICPDCVRKLYPELYKES